MGCRCTSCTALFGSWLDSFGLPTLEAMACRTPVAEFWFQAMADAIVHICTDATHRLLTVIGITCAIF